IATTTTAIIALVVDFKINSCPFRKLLLRGRAEARAPAWALFHTAYDTPSLTVGLPQTFQLLPSFLLITDD
ncbi:MAG: hypothetical protein ACR2LZ_01335, partial [Pyrinomonadaceae bacterium]